MADAYRRAAAGRAPRQTAGIAGLLVIGAAMAHGYTRGQRRVWVNEIDVAMPAMPRGLDGFRIAQLSDIHLGPFMADGDIARHVDHPNALGADLIVLTGDITDGLDHAPRTFAALARLSAPAGVIAILGNHDVGTGTDAVKRTLATYTDFTVLDDEVHVVEHPDERLWVIGLMDRGLDWARGLKRCRRWSAWVRRSRRRRRSWGFPTGRLCSRTLPSSAVRWCCRVTRTAARTACHGFPAASRPSPVS